MDMNFEPEPIIDIPFGDDSGLETLKKLGELKGYRFEEYRNWREHVVKMIRPDGSVAMVARREIH